MLKIDNWKKYYWFLVFSLLLSSVTNSFLINVNNLVKGLVSNYRYKLIMHKLCLDNQRLSKKVEYYKTSSGIKSLVKERLHKVEDGELIIKIDN